jgi:glycerol-3-phosphate dehydrogenase (NAD(P)+)
MSIPATIVTLAVLAYVAGATPFGYLAGRARGIDIRQHGSGNIGATNVIRVLGKRVGIPVFVLDFLKGMVPVLMAGWWCHRQPAFTDRESFVNMQGDRHFGGCHVWPGTLGSARRGRRLALDVCDFRLRFGGVDRRRGCAADRGGDTGIHPRRAKLAAGRPRCHRRRPGGLATPHEYRPSSRRNGTAPERITRRPAAMKRAGIVGCGSWGTALAVLLAENCANVRLWGRERSVIKSINFGRENAAYLPGVRLPEPIEATGRLDELADCEAVFVVVPSRAVPEVAAQLARVSLAENIPVISCVKGIEKSTGRRMSEVLHGALRHHPIAVLSGPNHAEEISRRQPAAAVIGCSDLSVALALQDALFCPWFRAYTSEDVCGIEWGAAAKNVFAIAAGIVEGLRLGDNAKAALVTRGLAELVRLGIAMGGRPETFHGLSGVGDLVVTCYSQHSRNNRVGQALGRGQRLAEIMASMNAVAEGVPNTESIHHAARRAGVRTPIIDTVYSILYQDLPCLEALRALLARDPRPESD